MAIMFITHDLGVVAEVADDVVVMYLGLVVERGPVDTIFHDPKHPYTQALLRSIPQIGPRVRQRLEFDQGNGAGSLQSSQGVPVPSPLCQAYPGVVRPDSARKG